MARRNDSVKPGCGIDGSKGENFTKKFRGDRWSFPPVTDTDEGLSIADKKAKHASNDDAGLRRVGIDSGTASYASRDIYNDVEGQSSDDGNRAVKSRG